MKWWTPINNILACEVVKQITSRAQRHIQRMCLRNRCMSAASIAAEVEGVGGSACQFSDHTLHTASNWFAWLSSQKEDSSKDDAQESPQKVFWRQADKGHGLLEPCPVVWWDKIYLFGLDGVKRVWGQQVRSTKTSVSCLQSSMVVGVSWSGAAWVLPALGSYSSLR